MQNNFDVSYATGSIILVTLGSLSLWQLARLVPALLEPLQVVVMVVAAITLACLLFTRKQEAITPYFLFWFLVGLGGILAWT
ncbi:hypothetical protein [[Limnothrix rosea] IAM M-220]|uniref:hypothetical protein n=1 Tax=[Limnothrix rosea] IAM M-220 TaxID=454133 RepID=UPI0009680E5C|nr:hypothetical protein [[Limnothrix rosea] IAM M-220]OKH12312.1 hypothetical protein NIES208_16325 [[Limnothrix rosea] IAM M-220]